eukprot:CAMPEP_0116134418 /NCGR_PEP_ID=MMETSP0329-20121206/10633_1 /TAXON_ID=697910 /ORGANISM="Pseudo-nitzschia arenysensis, Strain B593" /LENGTH=677 /DNA_ID=CAMNT_0003629123 /DNA_START=198 /DNA_END=2231 /DNA_ORIENTATION=+
MKGSQGLEALAALCGGQQKAVDMAAGAASASGTGTMPSTPPRTSPQTTAAPSNAVKSPNPVAATAAMANQLVIRQASEPANLANAISAGSIAAQKQQAFVSAPLPINADPSAAALSGLTPQQISQAIAAAANSQGGRMDPALAQSLLYPAALRGAASGAEAVAAATPVPAVPASANNILANTMQQLVLQQYLQAQANAQQQHVQQQAQAQAAATAAAAATSGHQQAALLAMTLAAGKAGQLLPTGAPAPIAVATNTTGQQASTSAQHQQQQQAQQVVQAQALLQHAAQQQQQQQLNTSGLTAIKPAKTGIHQHPQAIQQQYHFSNGTAGVGGTAAALPSMMKIAAAGGRILPSTEILPQNAMGVKTAASGGSPGSKKQQKRAANRRSAQLSRKRKKLFIEELKEENDDLRRKEQILRAIPDLVVVFDSSGRLGFVSESVGRFLDVSPDKLEGTSFWDLICEESVRMLKAAFMDSLAAREVDSDTATLGSGVWELRLKDKNNKYMIVTLNGVVHFKGDAPECVCCVRPLGEEQQYKKQQEKQLQEQQQKQSTIPSKQQLKDELDDNNAEKGDKANKSVNRAVSCSDGDASRSSDGSNRTQQSVLKSRHLSASMSTTAQDEAAMDAKKRNKKFRRVAASSGEGDSSSNDSSNNNNVEADGTNNSVRISDGDSNDGIESD